MRPIRVTGVTGVSVPVPLDVYTVGPGTQVYFNTAGAPTLTVTLDNVFDLTITPKWVAPPAAANANGVFTIPPGYRAVQGNGMVPADVLVVSQQGII
jgi:aminopeptidase N